MHLVILVAIHRETLVDGSSRRRESRSVVHQTCYCGTEVVGGIGGRIGFPRRGDVLAESVLSRAILI